MNDLDGFVCNFWRSVAHDPEQTVHWADWPVNENDLHARNVWLKARRKELSAKLEGDPDYYDSKIAGWWVWGMSVWIGGGFCGDSGPWDVVDGRLVHLGSAGQGVSRRLVLITDDGAGVTRNYGGILEWFTALSERLKRLRVCCGDWSRICGPTPTVKQGPTRVFLDPPYPGYEDYYSEVSDVAKQAAQWAIENGDNPLLRIAFCGYEGEYEFPKSWDCVAWKAHGGYSSRGNGPGKENPHRERIWFSPHCLGAVQKQLSFEPETENFSKQDLEWARDVFFSEPVLTVGEEIADERPNQKS